MRDFLIFMKKDKEQITPKNICEKFFEPIKENNRFCLYGGDGFFENEDVIVVCDGTVKPEDFAESLRKSNMETALKNQNGNFALAVYDKKSDTLTVARDRLGTHQIYYTNDGEGLWISNTFNPLFVRQNREIDLKNLQHFFTFQYVPEPLTLGKNVLALVSGHFAEESNGFVPTLFRKWKPAPDDKKDYDTFRTEVKDALTLAVNDSLSEYKKVGAFLSGGLDSSILVSLASQTHPDIKTYTIAFDVPGYSEAEVASRTAQHLGISHKTVKVDSKTFSESFADVVKATGVPVADPSAIAVSLISKGVAEDDDFDVVLSGEGSDELWGGYHVYNPSSLERKISKLPSFIKKTMWFFGQALPEGVKGKGIIQRGCVPLQERFVGNTFIFNEKEKKQLLLNYDKSVNYQDITRPYFDEIKGLNSMHQMQYIDTSLWLPGDINIVAGKGCTYRGLNVVMPFTDNRVTQLAEKLTVKDKLNGAQNKWTLRNAFGDILTEEVKLGKKKGYPVPVRYWLQGELYDWAVNLVEQSPVDEYINKSKAFALLKKCRDNKNDIYTYRKVWAILTFCMWVNVNILQND